MTEAHAFLEELRRQGRFDSSGRFTLDLEHARERMLRHQLEEPHEYVLRVFAAAIVRGATRFELKARTGVVQCEWDGQPFSERELHELMPSLLSSEPERLALRELAVGLNTARTLYGEIELTSGGHRLQLRNDNLSVEPAGESPGTTLWLKRPPSLRGLIRRLLGRRCREQELLARRTTLAPLAGTPRLAARPLLALQFGEPPLGLEAPTRQHPGLPEGCGYVLFEPGKAAQLTVVHCGVSYPCRPLWRGPLQVIWWTQTLPLDLSRAALVEPGFFHWAPEALTDAAIPLFESSPDVQQLAPLLAFLLDRRVKSLGELPLFRRADQSPVTLHELTRQFHEEGWLGRSDTPWTGTRSGWDPARFVLADAAAQMVLWTAFDNWVKVDDLPAGPRVRLPRNHEYLVRMPLEDGPGEVALENRVPGGTLTVFTGKVRERHRVAPSGMVLKLPLDGPADDWPIPMVSLYRALLHRDAPRELVTAHLLEFLTWAREDLPLPPLGRPALWQLMQDETARELAPELGTEWLRRMVNQVKLRGNRHDEIPLASLRKARKPLFYCPPDELPGDDLKVLILTELQAARVAALLRPVRSLRPALPWTPLLARVLEGARREGPVNTVDILRSVLAVPECTAARGLAHVLDLAELRERLAGEPPTGSHSRRYTSRAKGLFSRARQDSGVRKRLSTDTLVLAMLEVSCRARELLREMHVDRKLLWLACAPLVGEESPGEQLEVRDLAYQVVTTDTWKDLSGEPPTGEQLRRTSALSDAEALARGRAAQEMFLAGQPEIALEMLARVLSMLGPDASCEAWLLAHHAQVLLYLGSEREALKGCDDALRLDAFQPDANALAARLLSDPLAAVRQSQRALKLPGCPVSAWETQGLQLLKLARREDARHALEQFVTLASKERLMEPDVPTRIERARSLLRGLS